MRPQDSHSSSSSMIRYQTDDEGVVSQPEYTLTKPSNGPNDRDHLSPRNAGHRPNRATAPLVRQHQRALGVEPLEELSALARLQPAVRTPPPQQLAHRARQLHPAQARTLPHHVADQSQLPHAERASREPRRRHRVTGRRSRGHVLATTPYQNAARMSSSAQVGQAESSTRAVARRRGAPKEGGWTVRWAAGLKPSPRKRTGEGSSVVKNAREMGEKYSTKKSRTHSTLAQRKDAAALGRGGGTGTRTRWNRAGGRGDGVVKGDDQRGPAGIGRRAGRRRCRGTVARAGRGPQGAGRARRRLGGGVGKARRPGNARRPDGAVALDL